jgi:hypothetical protein
MPRILLLDATEPTEPEAYVFPWDGAPRHMKKAMREARSKRFEISLSDAGDLVTTSKRADDANEDDEEHDPSELTEEIVDYLKEQCTDRNKVPVPGRIDYDYYISLVED